jgi:hypothetical protein
MRIRYFAAGINTGVAYIEPGEPDGPYSISGEIFHGPPYNGVTLSLTGAATNNTWSTQTSRYGLVGLTNGEYTVTPTKPGYSFQPASANITIAGGNQTNINFTGTREVAMTWYVATNGSDKASGTSWAQAKQTIQAALLDVNAFGVVSNDTILVSNGVYTAIRVTMPVTVRSVNGPAMTVIRGGLAGDSVSTVQRCVYVGSNAVLSGFTLTNGKTPSNGDRARDQSGGGAWCEPSGTLSNCVLTGNSAAYDGGGASGGTLINCMLSNNIALGDGGGASGGTLNNCTLIDNLAEYDGGGVFGGTVNNCIVYYNNAVNGSGPNFYNSSFTYSCTMPFPGGPGNITDAPLFMNLHSNSRLQSNSPCINVGTNQTWMTGAVDLDGNPRIYGGGRVDMGAYEYQGSLSVIPTNWLAQYGLPIDGSEDHGDSDEDHMDNWAEWRCNTNPTNGTSFLGFATSDWEGTGFVLRWRSAEGVRYRLSRSSNLNVDAFGYLVRTNIVATPPINSETDTTAVGSGPQFYRVEVE